jgi:hypothetical protein
MCAEATNWYRHQLIVMATQCDRPNRIERIQSFKGSGSTVSICGFCANFRTFLHVVVNFCKNLVVNLFGNFVYDTVF